MDEKSKMLHKRQKWKRMVGLKKEGRVTYKRIMKYNYNNDKTIDNSTNYERGITIFDDFMEYVEKIITT